MANASIRTARADFLDPALYEESDGSSLPRLSRGVLLTALSRAFDLAEGRRPGHAQHVAYVGLYLAREMQLAAGATEDIFFACLLHDIGMAVASTVARSGRHAPAIANGADGLPGAGSTKWAGVLSLHCHLGAKVVRRCGVSETVARAVASHHDRWESSDLVEDEADARVRLVAGIASAADRVESIIDADASPLLVRRRTPKLVQEMAGSEINPEIALCFADIAARDDFWLGFYDNGLPTTLMGYDYGGVLDRPALFDLLGVMSDIVDARNGRDSGRGRRVADMARRFALQCDMAERRADLVKVAALLQDVGTLGVPSHYLAKPDILTIDEMSAVQLHSTYARDIVSEIPGLGAAAWWVGCHHERVDGKGYPGMLEGPEVPVEAQIIGMCEAFDALSHDRPYRPAIGRSDALDVLRGLKGTRFEARLVVKFERMITGG